MKELAFLLKVFFGAVLRAFFPAMFAEAKESFRDTAEDARPQPELKARLHKRIRARWGRQAVAGGLLLACLALGGCGTKVVFIPDGEPVRLRETIKNAPVWVTGADGVPVASRQDLPAGWYCLSDPGADAALPEDKQPEPPAAPALGVAVPLRPVEAVR